MLSFHATINPNAFHNNLTYLFVHLSLKLVPKETLVDAPLARLHVMTESFARVATRVEERAVVVVVVCLQLGDAQQFVLAPHAQLSDVRSHARQRVALVVRQLHGTAHTTKIQSSVRNNR